MNSNTNIDPISNHPTSSTSKRPAPKNNTAQNERYLRAMSTPYVLFCTIVTQIPLIVSWQASGDILKVKQM